MGHTRLGVIPKTKRFVQVVAAMTGAASGGEAGGGDEPVQRRSALLPDDVPQIAGQVLKAAQGGLIAAVEDEGLRYTVYLLTQIVLAARTENWQELLRQAGIDLPRDATPFDLTTEVQRAIDDHLAARAAVTDVSEIAQQAAGEALLTLTAPKADTLFGADLQPALHALSTKAGFSDLGQQFFSQFMYRYLNFYLSRITAKYTGGERLPTVGELARFNKTLETHCYQSARIVHDFCGGWYSKTNFEQGINQHNTSNFLRIALQKLRRELAQQEEGK